MLLSGEKVDDEVMSAASMVMKKQFPDLKGFQHTIFAEKENGFSPANSDSIQFHHINNHWVTSQLVDGKVVLYDSNYKQTIRIPHALQKQLKEIYELYIEDGKLVVEVAPVQKQKGGRDCGGFAIAFAVELGYGDQPQNQVYVQSKLRRHIVDCLDRGYFVPFPSTGRKTRAHRELILEHV